MVEPPLYFHRLSSRVESHPQLLPQVNASIEQTSDELRLLREFEAQLSQQQSAEAVRSILMLHYQALDPKASRLLRLLGLLAEGEFTRTLASTLLESSAETALDQLIALKLIQPVSPDLYRLTHPAIRVFARRQAGLEDTIADRQSARLRICDWYLEQLESNAAIEPIWFERERSNLIAAIEWAEQAQAWEAYVRLIEAVAEFFDHARDRRLGHQLSHHALNAAKQLNEPIHVAMILNNLGNFDLRDRSWHSAASHYDQSVALFGQLNDPVRAAQTFVNLGILAIQQGEFSTAIAHWKTAIAQLPLDAPEQRSIRQRMKAIDINVLEAAGGMIAPDPTANRFLQSLIEKFKRFILE